MLGSIDCCKCIWNNLPTAHHYGQPQHKHNEQHLSLMIEAVSDDRKRIWHMFFFLPCCNNDIKIFDSSPLQQKISSDLFPLPI